MTNEAENINSNQTINKRQENIKNFLKDKHNLIFVLILLFAIIIRLYHFNITQDQPIWWDESDYLAYAKNIAGYPVSWIVTEKHNSLYPFLVAPFFALGLPESIVKFLLQTLPGILTILLVYLTSNLMYKDKRVSLIASFIMSVFWVHLFDSTRFHIDVPALFVGLLSFYTFWKGYEKKEKIFGKIDSKWAIPLSVFLVVLTYSIRRGYAIFGSFFLVYMLLTRNFKELIKDKNNWIGLILAFVLLILSEKLIFISQIASVSGSYFHEELPINLLPLKVFESFSLFNFNQILSLSSIFFFLSWTGLFLLIYNLSLSFGYIRKDHSNSSKADLFNLIVILVTLAFFILVLRSPATPENPFGSEPRWYLPLAFSSFICISRAILVITDYIKPYNKHISLAILIALIFLGGYSQFKYGDSLIKEKINTFNGIKDASLYIKEVSNKEDVVIGIPRPQISYYAEREAINPHVWINWEGTKESSPMEPVLDKIRETPNVRYLIISFSEPNHPEWMKKVHYTNGQQTAWEIPFMDTKLDFVTQQQDIKQEKVYGNINFKLINVKNEVFIYEIVRS